MKAGARTCNTRYTLLSLIAVALLLSGWDDDSLNDPAQSPPTEALSDFTESTDTRENSGEDTAGGEDAPPFEDTEQTEDTAQTEDGSDFHGMGLVPDVKVIPTPKEFAAALGVVPDVEVIPAPKEFAAALGVVPDVEVIPAPEEFAAGIDPDLQRALEILKSP